MKGASDRGTDHGIATVDRGTLQGRMIPLAEAVVGHHCCQISVTQVEEKLPAYALSEEEVLLVH